MVVASGTTVVKPEPKLEHKQEIKQTVETVWLGNYRIKPWYGGSGYHDGNGNLGFDASQTCNDELYVCEYCFKYCHDQVQMIRHRIVCPLNADLPTLGKLVYRDDDAPYIIRQVKGFKHLLFCQNISLFGKLFLDDKSIQFHVDNYEFFVLYGFDDNDILKVNKRTPNFKPMGFFSKEAVDWSGNNNLACICIFPPYQRQRLGSLLIEFLYALARVTPGQHLSGPEFPLSPYGRATYLSFWSRKLAHVLLNLFPRKSHITILDIAEVTGYRKEDIMLTLEYMRVLQRLDDQVRLLMGNVEAWCVKRGIDPHQESSMLIDDNVLI